MMKIGFCNQNINTTGKYFTAGYKSTPSYADSTATLRCIEGYALGSAMCGRDGQWIIQYPDCRGIIYTLYKCVNYIQFCLLLLSLKLIWYST